MTYILNLVHNLSSINHTMVMPFTIPIQDILKEEMKESGGIKDKDVLICVARPPELNNPSQTNSPPISLLIFSLIFFIFISLILIWI